MKKIVFILFLFVLGCGNLNHTTTMTVTKKYVGMHVDTNYIESEDYYFVTTSMGIFMVEDSLNIPSNAFCYIRRELPRYDMHPDLSWQMEHQYITWSTTDKEYRLKKNVDFRRLRYERRRY